MALASFGFGFGLSLLEVVLVRWVGFGHSHTLTGQLRTGADKRNLTV
jgi:hypothetical protein